MGENAMNFYEMKFDNSVGKFCNGCLGWWKNNKKTICSG